MQDAGPRKIGSFRDDTSDSENEDKASLTQKRRSSATGKRKIRVVKKSRPRKDTAESDTKLELDELVGTATTEDFTPDLGAAGSVELMEKCLSLTAIEMIKTDTADQSLPDADRNQAALGWSVEGKPTDVTDDPKLAARPLPRLADGAMGETSWHLPNSMTGSQNSKKYRQGSKPWTQPPELLGSSYNQQVVAAPSSSYELGYPSEALCSSFTSKSEDYSSVPACGILARMRQNIEQQKPAGSLGVLPLFFRDVQMLCSCLCAILFLMFGIGTTVSAAGIREVVVSYDYPETSKTFSIPEDMQGEIIMWYDLAHVVGINSKRYMESVDPQMMHFSSLWGKKFCKGAEDRRSALWRRVAREKASRARKRSISIPHSVSSGSLDKFSLLVEDMAGPDLKPCGLQPMAMFSDQYELYRIDGTDTVRQALNESSVALEADDQIYEGKIMPFNRTHFKIAGQLSWLRRGTFFEHFKVWMRPPVSPHVRHLWAVVTGGLPRGVYRLNVTENSAIWTSPVGWGLSEKKVIFSTKHPLGSKGACTFIGSVCLVIGIVECLVAAMFCFVPKKKQALLDKE